MEKQLLDWIVVGGGIQGCTVAIHLLKQGITTEKQLKIIDPHAEPLFLWKRNTGRVEMEFLRSPSVHHLDVNPFSLQKYARVERLAETSAFHGTYKCPSLTLFHEHCTSLFKETNVEQCWQRGRVHYIRKENNSWLVCAGEQEYKSRNVVLAVGFTEQPHWPKWTDELGVPNAFGIYHLFQEELPKPPSGAHPIVVVGGGISAVQTAIALAEKNQNVSLLARHPFRIHEFDSDPGWLGLKYMKDFHKIGDFTERKKVILQARHRGSIPARLFTRLEQLRRKGQLSVLQGEVKRCELHDNGTKSLMLEDGTALPYVMTLLATGFLPNIKELGWLQSLIIGERLSIADCGFPILSKKLEWTKGLYVAGALAELEIGPTARNISGARRAAERIAVPS